MRNKDEKSLATTYIENLFAGEDEVLQHVRRKMQEVDKDGMSISAGEAKFLQMLIAANKVKTIVEVGTFAGYSAIWMARSLAKDGHLYTFEFDPKHAKMAQENFALAQLQDRITLLEGAASEQLKLIEDKAPFDMIFIDADKAGYPEYLTWAEKNVRSGGLIIGDNTFLFGSVYHDSCPEHETKRRYEAMREFNRRLADTSKYISILVATDEGMTVAVKK